MSHAHRQDSASNTSTTHQRIDAALATTDYSCKIVSWDDVGRGTEDGWWSNIADTCLKARDGRSLFTVRSNNWNEKLGVVRAEDVALLVGNCEAGGTMRNITLRQFLDDPAACGVSYAGIRSSVKLADAVGDEEVNIRFQTVFLPVEEDEPERGTIQIAAEAYSYSTNRSDDDPRDLILLATTQGLSVRTGGTDAKRLLLHAGIPGNLSEYWLKAESTRHKEGGKQMEVGEGQEGSLKRVKAMGGVIGIKAMGTRFNMLMTIQIPILQKPRKLFARRSQPFYILSVERASKSARGRGKGIGKKRTRRNSAAGSASRVADLSSDSSWGSSSEASDMRMAATEHDTMEGLDPVVPGQVVGKLDPTGAVDASRDDPPSPKKGRASAARVSRGDYYGRFKELPVTRPKRCEKEHVTVTCVLYHTVIGGVPNEVDVMAAVRDMDMLFAKCSASGRLANAAFDFTKEKLSIGDTEDLDLEEDFIGPHAIPPASSQCKPVGETPKEIVMAKFGELENASTLNADEVLELRLMTLGAVQDSKVSAVLVRKIDALASNIETGCDEAAKAVLPKLKLLLMGAFSAV